MHSPSDADLSNLTPFPAKCLFIFSGQNDSSPTFKNAKIMTKSSWLFLVFIWASIISNAQWTTSGDDIYYNSGNVGIGTSSPAKKLEVNGDISLPSVQEISRYIRGIHRVHTGESE